MNDELLFRGKYRISSARLRGYDYASPGRYFVTMCTKNRIPWFGYIRNGYVCLSDIGVVVFDEWYKTASIRSNIILDAFVVMPNHIHGIIEICDNHPNAVVETHRRCVSTTVRSLIPLPRRVPGSLGSIIAQYKSVCTKRIWAMGYGDFAWQPRFHDRIIWDAAGMNRACAYIRRNPWQWHHDHL